MLEIEVVDHTDGREFGAQAQVPIGADEKIGFVLAQHPWNGMLEIPVKKPGMARLGPCFYRNNVFAVNKTRIVSPVEDENKLMLRMLSGNTLKNLMRKPAKTFHFVFHQKPCIDCYSQLKK